MKPRTQFSYDEIESFGEKNNNYFKVLKDGCWGVIQLAERCSNNLIVLPCKFQEIDSSFPGFSIEKYVQVKYEDNYFYLDKEGQLKEGPIEYREIKEQFVFRKKKISIGKLLRSNLHLW